MTALPNKYKHVYQLKSGRNAVVYKATNALTGREVFLKIYSVPKNDPLLAIREPHLLTALAHSNLVKIYSADQNSIGGIILEMELLRDGSVDDFLRHAISTGEWPSIHTSLSIIRDMAQGLNHLHSQGYVHRDIKPANVMLRKRGPNYEGVITDMGLVSKLDGKGHAQGSKHARLYRPPEVWLNKPYTIASDLYQVGLTLYQLLGGQLNYKLSSLPDAELGQEVVKGSLIDLDTLGIHASPALVTLVRSLVREATMRLSHCNELLEELQLVIRNHHNWRLTSCAATMMACRTISKREIKIEIVSSTPKSHEARLFERAVGGNWRRKGKPVRVKHPVARRCRKLRMLLDK